MNRTSKRITCLSTKDTTEALPERRPVNNTHGGAAANVSATTSKRWRPTNRPTAVTLTLQLIPAVPAMLYFFEAFAYNAVPALTSAGPAEGAHSASRTDAT